MKVHHYSKALSWITRPRVTETATLETYIPELERMDFKPVEPAPWDKPETPWWEEKHEPAPWDAKEGGIVEPGVTHYPFRF